MNKKVDIITVEDASAINVRTELSLLTVKTEGEVKKKTSVIPKQIIQTDWLCWDDPQNDFPNLVTKDLESDYELAGLIDIYCKTLYSGGIRYGKYSQPDNNGKRIFIPMDIPEINDWLDLTSANLYLQEAFVDLKTFHNAWCELNMDGRGAAKGNIAAMSIQDANFCRHGKHNPKSKLKDSVYISANWLDPSQDKEKYFQVDPYFNPLKQAKDKMADVFYYPMIVPGVPGRINYALPFWNSIRKSKILELTKLMLDYEYAYLKNAASIRYHIELSEEYFKTKYMEKWSNAKRAEDRIKIIQAEQLAIDKLLMGNENSGKSVTSLLLRNAMGADATSIKITPIEHKIQSGQFEGSRNGFTAAKMRALGLRPDLAGGIGDKSNNLGGNSGSSSRVAANIHALENQAMQEIALSPFNKVIKYVNEWDKKYPGLVFITEQFFLATLDNVNPNNRL